MVVRRRECEDRSLPLSDLLQRLGDDRINLDTLVWQPGWKEWQKLTDVEEIRTQVLNVLPEQRRRVPPPLPTSSTVRSANPAPDIPLLGSTASSTEALYSQARPWIRFWARLFDICVFTLVFGPVLGFILFPERVITNMAQAMLCTVLAIFVWAFVEPAFLAFFGTSPGKKLMRIKLSAAGGSISYGRALLRSLRVWLWGLGAGLPLVWLLFAGIAGSKLQRNGVTSWDRKGGFVVSHQPVG
jgi:RDD family/GYF domain 2